jgi:hypothetical protein
MNFNTHKQQIVDAIEVALSKDKIEMIERFKYILGKCNSLFKTNNYTFWLKQLNSIPRAEIPMTKYGLENSLRSLSYLRKSDRNNLKSAILHICEMLFTYSNSEDLCPFQTEYHYYFYLPEQKVFKESEMGYSDLQQKNILLVDIRIAKISELAVGRSEFI